MRKDDIDKPMLRTVIGLALLGCEPMWSCCGYDYLGQPIHKRHVFGLLYICCRKNLASEIVLPKLPYLGGACNQWALLDYPRDGIPSLYLEFRWGHGKYAWTDWSPKDAHLFGEIPQVELSHLEFGISKLEECFQESAIIRDTNDDYRSRHPYWQYPTLGDWTVTMKDYEEAGKWTPFMPLSSPELSS
jgi:hypothetical protein